MKSKKALEILTKYSLFGIKPLLAFSSLLYKDSLLFFLYFLADVGNSFYQGYENDKNQDLSIENFEELKKGNKELKANYEKMAEVQMEYETDRKKKETSLGFLNKLVSDGLIREKDLLALAGTTGFYQLFVYSASLDRQVRSLGLERLIRQYPIFLVNLGFVRLGKNSTLFLINKNNLKDENLKNINELKRFLSFHFSLLRNKEWNEFLRKVKEKNLEGYNKLKKKSYKDWGYLKYNFLLTETNMNPTNIGFVDGERMGLGTAVNRNEIYSQILNRTKSNKIEITKELKVKIKRVFEKQDISILLEGAKQKDRDSVDISQDIIKENLSVENIIDFYKVNESDLQEQLKKIGFTKVRSVNLAKQIISKAKEYKNALDELRINI